MNDSSSIQDNWKIFRGNTNTGRLLSRLYGESPQDALNRVSYPKLKVRKDSNLTSRPRFNTFINRSTVDLDVVKRKQKAAALNIPKLGRTKNIPRSKVSTLPRLKSFAMCQVDIDRNRMYSDAYRPPNSKNLNDEKIKLYKVFEQNSGKALPVMPDRIRDSLSIMENEENLEPEQLTIVQQIVAEIEERRNHQKKMEESGVGIQSRERICAEITERLKELMIHDKHLALEMMKHT